MFMEEHLHSTTVTAAMRILVVLLSNQPILIKFKEGVSGGGWLDQTDSVLTNKIGTVLGKCLKCIIGNGDHFSCINVSKIFYLTTILKTEAPDPSRL